jgi:hypothetical protein
MIKSVPVAKFELYSSLVGINVSLKWLFGVKIVFFICSEDC